MKVRIYHERYEGPFQRKLYHSTDWRDHKGSFSINYNDAKEITINPDTPIDALTSRAISLFPGLEEQIATYKEPSVTLHFKLAPGNMRELTQSDNLTALREAWVTYLQSRNLDVRPIDLTLSTYDAEVVRTDNAAVEASRRACITRFNAIHARLHNEAISFTSDDDLMATMRDLLTLNCPYNHVDGEPEKMEPWLNVHMPSCDKKLAEWMARRKQNHEQMTRIWASSEFVHLLAKSPGTDEYRENALENLLHFQDLGNVIGGKSSPMNRLSQVIRGLSVDTHIEFLVKVIELRLAGAVRCRLGLPYTWLKEIFRKRPEALKRFPREVIDVHCFNENCEKLLPPVLPPECELIAMSPSDIESMIAAYSGLPLDTLLQELRPGQASEAGFIRESDRLGQVIVDDARRLLELEVSRFELALFLHGLTENAQPAEWIEVESVAYCGLQDDPFLPGYPSSPDSRSDCDFSVYRVNDGQRVLLFRFAGLIPSLIQRFCFFESTSYRVNPEVVVKLFRQAEWRKNQ